ncbi:DUF4222 domain-containing protein [Escherichia coli]|uniref:DUF4222 domain-containing protein n=2 Tax=Escherichia coli TaxID=562 RepID=UPI001F37C5E7|nr:DUF4222 domain-containing protein [Escherichia coli]
MKKKNSGFTASGLSRPEIRPGDIFKDKYGGTVTIKSVAGRCVTYRRDGYRALMAGGVRYDLKGQPCGEVTPQEQQDAETRLVALNEKRKRQRRAAKEKTGA